MPCFSLSRLLQLSFIHPSIAATTTNINKTTEIRRQRTKPTKENNKEQRRRRTTLFKHSQADSHIQTHVTGTTFTLLVACLRTDKNSKYTHGYTTNTHDEIIKNTFMVFIIIFSFHYCLSFISFTVSCPLLDYGVCVLCALLFTFFFLVTNFGIFTFYFHFPLKNHQKDFCTILFFSRSFRTSTMEKVPDFLTILFVFVLSLHLCCRKLTKIKLEPIYI